MELRHLETLLAIDSEGSFTGAADALATVQSNVSEQVRQLESELGVRLLVRGRKGATPTEFGVVVLDRARRALRELEAMRTDLSMLHGLRAGSARLGVVGTASSWLVPSVLRDLRSRAPGVRLRVTEAASERLFTEVLDGELAQAVVTEPVEDRRLIVDHLLEEALVGLVPGDTPLPPEPVPFVALSELPMVLPPVENPLRIEVETFAAAHGLSLQVPVEIEGIRLIPDLVGVTGCATVLPETALPRDLPDVRVVAIADLPPRRLAVVRARDVRLSLADEAVRESIDGLIEGRSGSRPSARGAVPSGSDRR